MDLSLKKTIRVAEGINLEFQGVFANVLNHNQWLDPTGTTALDGSDPSGSVSEICQAAKAQPVGGNRAIRAVAFASS